MNTQEIREITGKLGLKWKGDFFDSLSEDEKRNGYVKFNIPNPKTPRNLNGEGVWGWMFPADKKKYDDDSFTGKLTVILCNDPFYYSGTLFAGQELVIRCNGENRPILDPDWVQEHLSIVDKNAEEIAAAAIRLLKSFTDDYAGRIWEKIKDSVIDDVLMCSGIEDGDGFTDGDVCLSIGRSICELDGIEV